MNGCYSGNEPYVILMLSALRADGRRLLTDDAADEGGSLGRIADHRAVLPAALAPATDGDHGLQMRMLLLQGDELLEAALLHVEFFVEDQHIPGDVTYSDEGVDNVRAHISGDVVDAITAYVWAVDGPVTEVTDQLWGL